MLPGHLTSASFAIANMHEREVEAGGSRLKKSSWEKYLERKPTEENVNFINYIRYYNVDTHKKRSKQCVPRIFPNIRVTGPDDEKFDEYCKHLLQLHKPCRSIEDLRETPQLSWSQALRAFIAEGGLLPPRDLDMLNGSNDTQLPNDSEDEEEESEGEDEEVVNDDWMMAGLPLQIPNESIQNVEVNWNEYWDSVSNIADGAGDFIKISKMHANVEYEHPQSVNIDNLNVEQRRAFDILQTACGEEVAMVRMILSGTAGSGKSYLIMALRQRIIDAYPEGCRRIRVCAPTGTAAFNVQGDTLHRVLSLPVPITSELPELRGEQLSNLQNNLVGLRLLIIDEMSMVGRKMLRSVDLRLRQAFPHYSNMPFGGISICLMGDFGQLAPVLDRPMYDRTSGGGRLSEDGRVSYKSFNRFVELKRVERVQGSSPLQEAFRNTLTNVRNGTINENDYRLLCTRISSRLHPDEIKSFEGAPRLVATHKEESAYNLQRLKSLNSPICSIKAVHQPKKALKRTAQHANGLEPILHLSVGSKVILKSNLWVPAGLTNGSLGTVRGILYPPGSGGPDGLPTAVCVHFPGYRGPPWDVNDPLVVPIPPVSVRWMEGSAMHSRTQIPLALAFAVTIHKSQGWTRDKVILDFGPKEFSLGLTFVALSRVKSIKGILISPSSPNHAQWGRYIQINNHVAHEKRRQAEKNLLKLNY